MARLTYGFTATIVRRPRTHIKVRELIIEHHENLNSATPIDVVRVASWNSLRDLKHQFEVNCCVEGFPDTTN